MFFFFLNIIFNNIFCISGIERTHGDKREQLQLYIKVKNKITKGLPIRKIKKSASSADFNDGKRGEVYFLK